MLPWSQPCVTTMSNIKQDKRFWLSMLSWSLSLDWKPLVLLSKSNCFKLRCYIDQFFISKTDILEPQSGEQHWSEQLQRKSTKTITFQMDMWAETKTIPECSAVRCSEVQRNAVLFLPVVRGRVGMGVTHYIARWYDLDTTTPLSNGLERNYCSTF